MQNKQKCVKMKNCKKNTNINKIGSNIYVCCILLRVFLLYCYVSMSRIFSKLSRNCPSSTTADALRRLGGEAEGRLREPAGLLVGRGGRGKEYKNTQKQNK